MSEFSACRKIRGARVVVWVKCPNSVMLFLPHLLTFRKKAEAVKIGDVRSGGVSGRTLAWVSEELVSNNNSRNSQLAEYFKNCRILWYTCYILAHLNFIMTLSNDPIIPILLEV